MNDKSVLVEFFGDYPIIRVVDFLIENRGLDFTKTDIAKSADVGLTTLHLIWDRIETADLVKVTRTFGNTKLYMLNEESEIVQRLMRLELDLMKHFGAMDVKTAGKKIKV